MRSFNLYRLPNIIGVIKSKRIGSVGFVARMGRGGVHTEFWWGNLRERDNLEHPGMERRVILKLIFNKWTEGGALTGLMWIRIGTGSG